MKLLRDKSRGLDRVLGADEDVMVSVAAGSIWLFCLVYWATLADCLEGKACSWPHILLNQLTFAGIFVIPVVLLVAWSVDIVRRRGR